MSSVDYTNFVAERSRAGSAQFQSASHKSEIGVGNNSMEMSQLM
jgi:hypothetical protein